MDVSAEARQLDEGIAVIVRRMGGRDYMRLGKFMDKMTDKDRPLWALLTDPRTGRLYDSQEAWVMVRLRSQRATAFAARQLYRTLKHTVPDEVMESTEPGTLKVMASLPASAQRDTSIQKLATTSSVGEFTQMVLKEFPNELHDKRVVWALKPTLTQAAMYDRVLEKIQGYYGEKDIPVSREDALEYLLRDSEEQLNSAEKEA
jgi:hypothetical protein